MPLILYCIIALAGSLGLLLILHRKRRALMLPPGPPGDALVGHLLRMPSIDSALVFPEWAKTLHRAMHQSYLNRNKAEDFKAMQTQEARTLVQNWFESTPDEYEKCMGRQVSFPSP
ncbi:hypothetical protein DFH08DRAFT_825254 [Mycena albidolilacea]|uniref:Uncharacterized protein n=1 Tax=Mycena albidolilacea TaxID=1033008 RepID=A0AAD6Z2L4_9AGAR|nr:hypothetical protein DFH08DRAFT_825254 [Mycena albidolilacea]